MLLAALEHILVTATGSRWMAHSFHIRQIGDHSFPRRAQRCGRAVIHNSQSEVTCVFFRAMEKNGNRRVLLCPLFEDLSLSWLKVRSESVVGIYRTENDNSAARMIFSVKQWWRLAGKSPKDKVVSIQNGSRILRKRFGANLLFQLRASSKWRKDKSRRYRSRFFINNVSRWCFAAICRC